MNFWQIVMLMAWLALFAVLVWALVAVFIDVVRRGDVSGVATVGWILFVLLVPAIGILAYVATRPKLSRGEQGDVDAHNEAVLTDGSAAAYEIAELAQLRFDGAIDDDEYQVLKNRIINA